MSHAPATGKAWLLDRKHYCIYAAVMLLNTDAAINMKSTTATFA